MLSSSASFVEHAHEFFTDKIPRSSNIQDLLEKGFSLKKQKEKNLSRKDTEKLKETVSEYDKIDKNGVKNEIYFLKHYIFENTVTEEQLENRINQQLIGAVFFLFFFILNLYKFSSPKFLFVA